jgi:transcriptional regulator with XRE-family HTH domain
MDLTAAQIRAARALLGWNQEKLAEASLVGVATIRRFEANRTQEMGQLQERGLRQALEAAGVEFIGRRGVALKEA